MNVFRFLAAAVGALTLSVAPACAADAVPAPAPAVETAVTGPFLVKPYLQLGHSQKPRAIQLMWHSVEADADWAVEVQASTGQPWQKGEISEPRKVVIDGVAPHRVYRALLTGLEPGGTFTYRVRRGTEVVFSAEAHAPKEGVQPFRFVAFGDCGAGTPEQRPIAYRAYQSKPDLLVIPGDVVYASGRISEYRQKFWPVYNADEASPTLGVPMLRSTLFVAVPGNHDIGSRDLNKFPDGLAYYYYWRQPLNGPILEEGTPLAAPVTGSETNKKAFLDAARKAFPRMANFSFNYGNAHWTVLDANTYVDWSRPELKEWVEQDLAAARGATWRFVSFHQPGFNSAKEHFEEQLTRLMAPVFEAGKVDVVFNGHVHNYQRSYPLRFAPSEGGISDAPVGKNGKPRKGKLVAGKWTLDRSFDGVNDTTPNGVIYVVTGAGGQHLYNPEQQDDPASWQEFTHKFISKIHSITVADVNGATLSVRQVTAEGEEVDRFTITK